MTHKGPAFGAVVIDKTSLGIGSANFDVRIMEEALAKDGDCFMTVASLFVRFVNSIEIVLIESYPQEGTSSPSPSNGATTRRLDSRTSGNQHQQRQQQGSSPASSPTTASHHQSQSSPPLPPQQQQKVERVWELRDRTGSRAFIPDEALRRDLWFKGGT